MKQILQKQYDPGEGNALEVITTPLVGIVDVILPVAGTLERLDIYGTLVSGGDATFNVVLAGANLFSGATRPVLTGSVVTKTGLANAVVVGDLLRLSLEALTGSGIYSSITFRAVIEDGVVLVTNLNSLSDVDLATVAPANNNVLVYDSVLGLWLPEAPSGGGASPTLNYDINANSACLFHWNETELDSETDRVAVAQMTDLSGNNNHAIQATSTKRALAEHSVQGDANALLFTAADQEHYAVAASLGYRHIFALAAFHPVAAAAQVFDQYNCLISLVGYDWLLLGDIGNTYWRSWERSSADTVAIDGWAKVGAASTANIWPAQIQAIDIPLMFHLYEWYSSTTRTGNLMIGSNNQTALQYWNGHIAAIAAFDAVQTGDTLRKIRRQMCLRTGTLTR